MSVLLTWNTWRFLERSYIGHGGFLKWWYPTTMGFPTKNDHLGCLGVPPVKETPTWWANASPLLDWSKEPEVKGSIIQVVNYQPQVPAFRSDVFGGIYLPLMSWLPIWHLDTWIWQQKYIHRLDYLYLGHWEANPSIHPKTKMEPENGALEEKLPFWEMVIRGSMLDINQTWNRWDVGIPTHSICHLL